MIRSVNKSALNAARRCEFGAMDDVDAIVVPVILVRSKAIRIYVVRLRVLV